MRCRVRTEAWANPPLSVSHSRHLPMVSLNVCAGGLLKLLAVFVSQFAPPGSSVRWWNLNVHNNGKCITRQHDTTCHHPLHTATPHTATPHTATPHTATTTHSHTKSQTATTEPDKAAMCSPSPLPRRRNHIRVLRVGHCRRHHSKLPAQKVQVGGHGGRDGRSQSSHPGLGLGGSGGTGA